LFRQTRETFITQKYVERAYIASLESILSLPENKGKTNLDFLFYAQVVNGKPGDLDKIAAFVAHGVNINTKQTEQMSTPLHEAVAKDDATTGMVSPLKHVEHSTGLNFNYTSNTFVTAMFLLSHGADLTAVDSYGNSPLHYSYLHEADKCREVLLSAGASTDLCNNDHLFPADLTPSLEV